MARGISPTNCHSTFLHPSCLLPDAGSLAHFISNPRDGRIKEFTGALKSLFALAEAYPDLKANTSFLSLQEELTSTEDRIAYARQFYNDSVMKYDNKIESIPSNIIAGMFGFKGREYFKAEEGATEVPRVQF